MSLDASRFELFSLAIRRWRRAISSVLVGVSVLAEARASSAEHVPRAGATTVTASATASKPAASRWYGWQTLLVDAASAWMMLYDHESDALRLVGLSSYVAGGPTVHLIHEQWWKAAVSTPLRIALPLIGYAAGEGLRPKEKPSCDGCGGGWSGAGWPLGGVLIGMGTACLMDIALLAHERVPVDGKASSAQPTPRSSPRPTARARVTPTVGISPSSGVIGLAGTF